MTGYKGLNTPYDDCVVPTPGGSDSAGTSFGEPLTGGQAPTTGGEWGSGVQYSKVDGGEPGVKDFIKIPGSGGNHN